jgi:uncharacterized membrane protein YhhN
VAYRFLARCRKHLDKMRFALGTFAILMAAMTMHAKIRDSGFVKIAALLGLLGCLLILKQPGHAQETVPREYEGFTDVQQHRGVIDDRH